MENAANPAVTLTVSMTSAATSNTTILLGVSGTATGGGVDYSIGSTTLVIPAGSTSITTTLSSNDDPYYDDGETIIVEISSVSGSMAAESGNQSETVTINDDEAQPTVSLTVLELAAEGLLEDDVDLGDLRVRVQVAVLPGGEREVAQPDPEQHGEHADDEAMDRAMAGGGYHTGDVVTIEYPIETECP